MQPAKQTIAYLILGIASIIAIILIWNQAEDAYAPSTDVTSPTGAVVSETELPDFARVEMNDGQRVLINERDGYEIPLEDNWRPEYYTNVVEVFVEDDYPSGELTASFVLSKNPTSTRSFISWVDFWIEIANQDCVGCYKSVENFSVEGIEIVKVKDTAGMGDRYHYLLDHSGLYYDFRTANMSEKEVIKIIKEL